MPIYEYRCEHCGEFEEMQRITDPPLARCPRCHRKVRRLISNTSFQLKGSGWYVTDYARAGAGNGAKKEGGADAGAPAEGKAEGKAEGNKSSASGTSEKPAS
jgi:putative FmdB family regulatory protein